MRVLCVELLDENRAILTAAGYELIGRDFLTVDPMKVDPVAACAMNPPFANEADIIHVRHAARFVRPGGQVAAITSGHVEFAQGKRAEEFRAFVAQHQGTIKRLPEGSFLESGTGVRTALVRFVACERCRTGF